MEGEDPKLTEYFGSMFAVMPCLSQLTRYGIDWQIHSNILGRVSEFAQVTQLLYIILMVYVATNILNGICFATKAAYDDLEGTVQQEFTKHNRVLAVVVIRSLWNGPSWKRI